MSTFPQQVIHDHSYGATLPSLKDKRCTERVCKHESCLRSMCPNIHSSGLPCARPWGNRAHPPCSQTQASNRNTNCSVWLWPFLPSSHSEARNLFLTEIQLKMEVGRRVFATPYALINSTVLSFQSWICNRLHMIPDAAYTCLINNTATLTG